LFILCRLRDVKEKDGVNFGTENTGQDRH
jgi:hypothetical protein